MCPGQELVLVHVRVCVCVCVGFWAVKFSNYPSMVQTKVLLSLYVRRSVLCYSYSLVDIRSATS